MGQQPLAEDLTVNIVLDRASYLKAVRTGQTLLCKSAVHSGCLQQEGYILQTGLPGGEIEDLPHVQMIVQSRLVRDRIRAVAGIGLILRIHLIQKDFITLRDEDYGIVVILYDSP